MKGRVWKYIRNYRFNSLFVRTYLLILALAILPLAGVSLYLARYFQQVAVRQTITINESETDQTRAAFDQLVNQVYRLIADIGTNYKVLGFMTAGEGELTSDERFFLFQDIDTELLHPFRSMVGVRTVNIASFSNGLIISSDRGMLDMRGTETLTALQAEVAARRGRVGWFGLRTVGYPNSEQVLSLYWRMPPHTDELLGTVFVEFEPDSLRRVLAVPGEGNYQPFLLDEVDMVLFLSLIHI